MGNTSHYQQARGELTPILVGATRGSVHSGLTAVES